MLSEVLQALVVKPGGRYVDGTLGGGGHAAAILAASSPNGWLFGCDRDGDAVERVQRRLAPYAGRYEIRHGNFSELDRWVPVGSCDGVLLDLGVSSPQLDDPERGFSLLRDGPLDMRMDRTRPGTAADLVNAASAEELAGIFWDFGGERESRRFARAIVQDREKRSFVSTRQLAELIERLSPRAGRRVHPATRVFQALRIAVNKEMESLHKGLAACFSLLHPAGRMAVITFHSGEDRLVKEWARQLARDYDFAGPVDVPELRTPRRPEAGIVTRRPVMPSPQEIAQNPRARSSQLRVVEKI
jgi:16S rRNA (cytosine1402-N4)-methyltransferase